MASIEQQDLLDRIREELSDLARFVDKTRKGLDTLESTVRIGNEKFPEASNQLTAVTGDLENAANNIMNILEALMQEQDKNQAQIKELAALIKDNAKAVSILKNIEEISVKSKNDMMDIFSNMSFQDLTGQKLKKVIGGLSVVESKVLELAVNFGVGGNFENKAVILNQLKGATVEQAPIKQDVVDEILKKLGT